MGWKILVANIIGIICVFLNFLASQQKSKKNILLFNASLNTVNIIQYILLGAYTGAISCGIAVCRNIVFGSFKKKIPLVCLIVYLMIVIAFNYRFIDGIISLIPVINICAYGIGLYQPSVGVLKTITIIVDSIGAVYDFFAKAYISCLNCVVSVFGSTISFVDYIKDSKKKKRGRSRKKKK